MFGFKNKKRLLNLQKIVMHNSPDKLVMTETQLNESAECLAQNALRIMTDSMNLVNTTKRLDVYFERYSLLLEKTKKLVELEPYINFNGDSPSSILKQVYENKKLNTYDFLKRYFSAAAKKVDSIKSSDSKKNYLQKCYDNLQLYWDYIDGENQSYAKCEFEKLFNDLSKSIYNPHAINYKMDTLEEIESIPVPTEKFEYNCDFTKSIEYVLQRKATQFKKAGNMECAIACLKKSNEIMPFAPMDYTKNDYGRLEKYLKMAGKFDDAVKVQESNQIIFKNDDLYLKKRILDDAKQLNTDLLEADYPEPSSEIEAMYRGRIYSISGKDSMFPALPEDIWNTRLSLHPFIYGVSEALYCPIGQEIEFSTRPFIDDRDKSEIEAFDNMLSEILRKSKNEKDYYWILENLPDMAPKSLSGYSRMKNSNSKNFQKLRHAAHDMGYEIALSEPEPQPTTRTYPPDEILHTKWGTYEMPEPYTINFIKGPRTDLKKIDI